MDLKSPVVLNWYLNTDGFCLYPSSVPRPGLSNYLLCVCWPLENAQKAILDALKSINAMGHSSCCKTSLESTFLHYKHCKQFGHIILVWYYTFLEFFPFCHALHQGWAGKAFWFPGTGREIENHISVLREGNGNSQIATGREGKFEACYPGNPGKSRESYKKQD